MFRKILRIDGFIGKYKARLIVVGYKQIEGVDFFDTFSPVSKIPTILKF